MKVLETKNIVIYSTEATGMLKSKLINKMTDKTVKR